MNGYIKYFDNGVKNMTFVTDNEKVYDKYNEIWEAIRKFLKVKFTVKPVRDDKYSVTKLKIFNRINRTTFNKAYHQAYLEQCKYKLKKRKIVNYIDDDIIDDGSDSGIDDAVNSHLNFSVPDSYVKI